MEIEKKPDLKSELGGSANPEGIGGLSPRDAEFLRGIPHLYSNIDLNAPNLDAIRRAAENGDHGAEYYLGEAYLDGKTPEGSIQLPQDIPAAIDMLSRAQKSDNPAQALLAETTLGIALLYSKNREEQARGRKMLPPLLEDDRFQIAGARKVLTRTLFHARANLANALCEGYGGPSDPEEAARLLRKNIAEGDRSEYAEKLLNRIAADREANLKRQKKRSAEEKRKRHTSHIGAFLLRAAELAALCGATCYAMHYRGYPEWTLPAVMDAFHLGLLIFLAFGAGGLLFAICVGDSPIAATVWCVIATVLAGVGAFNLEKSSFARANYQTYILILDLIGAGLAVFFLYKLVRHFYGVLTGK